MWVVEPSRSARKRRSNPSSCRPARNAGLRASCAASMTSTVVDDVVGLASARAARAPARSGPRPRRAAGWRGTRARGTSPAPACGRWSRRRRGPRGSDAPARQHAVAHRSGDLAAVEGVRAPLPQELDRSRPARGTSPSPPRRAPCHRGGRSPAPRGSRARIGSRSASRYACSRLSTTPTRASSAPRSSRTRKGNEPNRLAASARPLGTPGTPHDAAPTLKTCVASPKSISIGRSSDAALDPAQPRGGDEEVEEDGLLARAVDEHVAAGAEARERALRDQGGAHRGDGRVDRVAALAERSSAGLGGLGMPRGDYAAARHRPVSWG